MERDFLKNSRILIVDDKVANIELLTGLLDYEGYENVKYTVDSREVLQLYNDFQPDLILLDLMMPFLNGFEIMELLNKSISSAIYLPILVLTADASDEVKKRALASGATDFLAKPFDLIEVALRVKNLLFISYLNKQLRNQNSILEERVKERTEELNLQNIELEKAWKKAEASDKLKTAFINSISHEIRTPLNGIIGFTQLLSESDISNEEREKYIELVNESSDRLISTVTNFMDISLLNTGNMEVAAKEVSAGIILFCIFQKFERICKSKNIKLEVQIDPTTEDLIFLSDELLLKKVLIHLVDNATKFTREGKIIIGIKNRQNDLCFYVEDTGIGIAEESKKDIFKSFMQEEFGLSRSYDGSGLGLSIAKGFVELAGGDIWFDDNPEKGTTFFFTIPLIRSIKHIGKADEHPKLQTKVKILVVEDDKINLKYISILLNNELIEVLYAMDGITAVETFRSHPDIKVVLMDLIIPGQDGFKATEQIKEINAEVPVFALTALAFNEHREKAHQSGCDEFLIKPLRKIELYEKLNKYGVYLS